MEQDSKIFHMTYNASLLRVRVAFKCGDMKRLSAIPEDLFTRAQDKMEKEKEKGLIIKHRLYLTRLEKIRKILSEAESPVWPDAFDVHLTLAAGIPKINGLHFHPETDNSTSIGKLQIKISGDLIRTFHPKIFHLVIQDLIETSGSSAHPCPAQTTAIYFRILSGLKDDEINLRPAIRMPEPPVSQPYAFRYYTDNELALVVFNIAAFRKKEMFEHMEKHLNKISHKMPGQATKWTKIIRSEISLALHGIEHFGLEMPLTILAASSSNRKVTENLQKEQAPQPEKEAHPVTSHAPESEKAPSPPTSIVPEDYPGKNLLHLIIAPDKMQATITNFNISFYENVEEGIDETWLNHELHRYGIKQISKEGLERVRDNIIRKRDLNGIVIAEGIPPEPAGKSVIVPVSEQNKPKTPATNQEDKTINLRSMKQDLTMVLNGQLIARLVCTEPAKSGQDIFGEEIPPPATKDSQLEIGAGVRAGDSGEFYAELDGLLSITEHGIHVIHAYHHKGDVNLTSGDIRFDGPVLINGNVESGSSVFSGQSIHITGQIRGGTVRCHGDLKAEKGIITGLNHSLFCGGDIEAKFIENSVIDCKGSITVSKAILSSTVCCSGQIRVTAADGTCAGSDLHVWDNLITHNLGYPKGKKTRIFLGEDWLVSRKLHRNQERMLIFNKLRDKVRAELRDLLRKDKRQMGRKSTEMKSKLQSDNLKLKSIVSRIEQRIHDLQQQLIFNRDSYIQVNDTCYSNCNITINKDEVSIPDQMKAIVILANPHHGQRLISIDKFKKPEKREED
ncbi:MAG: DUF342 domain-containing protein [Deltaproteobacteria bacterium]|nr:DUF342 domain-containing protein [Deltaproteobacteria bacterium]